MNLALGDLPDASDAEILAISNFTLYGDAVKSRRPSFMGAAGYEEGKHLFSGFVSALREINSKVETGVFGADMKIELLNDGPVTLVIDV